MLHLDPSKATVNFRYFKGETATEALLNYELAKDEFNLLYAPQVALLRILNPDSKELWGQRIDTPTILARGTSTVGNPVVVVSHMPDSGNESIDYTINSIPTSNDQDHPRRKLDSSIQLSKEMFKSLLVLDGIKDDLGITLVKVIDEAVLHDYHVNVYRDEYCIPLDKVAKHPVFQALMGNEVIADAYLKCHADRGLQTDIDVGLHFQRNEGTAYFCKFEMFQAGGRYSAHLHGDMGMLTFDAPYWTFIGKDVNAPQATPESMTTLLQEFKADNSFEKIQQANAMLKQAEQLFCDRKLPEAQRLYNQVLEMYPNNPDAAKMYGLSGFMGAVNGMFEKPCKRQGSTITRRVRSAFARLLKR
jgi:hypothetical protein